MSPQASLILRLHEQGYDLQDLANGAGLTLRDVQDVNAYLALTRARQSHRLFLALVNSE